MSVMLRCQCGHEVTVPEQATAGLVTCPVCRGQIDPAKSVVHPSLDDLDPELLLAPDDDFQPAAKPVPPTAPASTAVDDDFPGLADFASPAPSDELARQPDPSPPLSELPFDLGFADDAATTESSSLPDDFLSEPPIELIPPSAAAPSIQPPAADDEGYAIVEEDFGKSAETPAWLNPNAEIPADVPDEIQIADESIQAAPVTAGLVPDDFAPPTAKTAASKPTAHDLLDDLLDDEIHIAPEEQPAVPETPLECPECKAALTPGSLLCIACGYNLKTSQKMQGAPEAKGKGGKAKPAKSKASGGGAAWQAKLKEPRVMLAVGGVGVVVLLLISWLLFAGGESPQPVAAQPETPSGPEASGAPTTPGTPENPSAPSPAGETAPPIAVDPSRAVLVSIPTGVQGKVASFDFSADGKLLAIGDENGSATIWSSENSEAGPPLAMGASSPVQVSFSADAKQLLTGFSGGAKLWDIAAGTAREFKSPVDGLFAARFSPDGQRFFTSGPTGIFSIVDLAAGGRVTTAKLPLPPGVVPVVDVTPDGRFGVVGGEEGLLMVWDLAAGRPVALLEGHTARVAAVAISPDGQRVLSAAGGPEYRTVGEQRYLMSSRPTDVNVRVWDATGGKELWRLHTPPEKQVTCLAFSADGTRAAIVAGDVQIIDVEAKQQVTQIVPAKQGATPQPDLLPPPTEPFRLAAFFPDGKRLVTTCQNSGIHIWSLPEKPEPKPLSGVSEPADLAAFKLASWEPIAPLLIPVTAAEDDAETAERLANAAKAADETANRIPLVAKLREVLASKPRMPEPLIKLSQACQSKELYLEAEECLRAALMAEPTNEKARQMYEALGSLGPKGTGPISVMRAWVQEVPDLEDAGLRSEPPRHTYVVSVPIEIAVVDRVTRLDSNTLVGKAGDQEADFLGIHHRPSGEITGKRKTPGGGDASMTGQLQVWEAMAVAQDKNSGDRVVQLSNRRMPVREQLRPGAAASNEPKVKLVRDSSKVKEDYKGPYEALFAVPEGQTLSEIRWEETQPIRILGEEPKSLDALALDSDAELSQRLAAIEALGVSPTKDAADTLLKVIASGDPKLFDTARAALRGVRRRGNLVSPEYLPTPDAAAARLLAISFGSIDGNALTQSHQPAYGQPSGAASSLPVNSNYSYCKTLWNLDQPGQYLARVAVFGEPPTFSRQLTLEFEFAAAEPNLYIARAKVERPAEGDVQVVELWRDNNLIERRILSASPGAASSLAASLPLEPPVKPQEEPAAPQQPQFAGNPVDDGTPEMIRDLFPGTLTPAYVAPLLGSKPSALPPIERAVLETLLTALPADAQAKIPATLAAVTRLEIGNEPLTSSILKQLRQLPGDAATGLFIRLSETASPPAALAAIDALHAVGNQSPAACRALIDLQAGPADLREAAESAVNDLMTQGIIAHEGGNWRYHGESHLPEEPKDQSEPTENETASP